jgi:hypothetical protein
VYPTNFESQWAEYIFGHLLGMVQGSGVNFNPIPNPDCDCGSRWLAYTLCSEDWKWKQEEKTNRQTLSKQRCHDFATSVSSSFEVSLKTLALLV